MRLTICMTKPVCSHSNLNKSAGELGSHCGMARALPQFCATLVPSSSPTSLSFSPCSALVNWSHHPAGAGDRYVHSLYHTDKMLTPAAQPYRCHSPSPSPSPLSLPYRMRRHQTLALFARAWPYGFLAQLHGLPWSPSLVSHDTSPLSFPRLTSPAPCSLCPYVHHRHETNTSNVRFVPMSTSFACTQPHGCLALARMDSLHPTLCNNALSHMFSTLSFRFRLQKKQ
jgi:hypothetical protein